MTQERIFSLLREHLLIVVPELAGTAIEPGSSMQELEVDSLDRLDVISAALAQLGADMPLAPLSTASNLGELAELIHREVAVRA